MAQAAVAGIFNTMPGMRIPGPHAAALACPDGSLHPPPRGRDAATSTASRPPRPLAGFALGKCRRQSLIRVGKARAASSDCCAQATSSAGERQPLRHRGRIEGPQPLAQGGEHRFRRRRPLSPATRRTGRAVFSPITGQGGSPAALCAPSSRTAGGHPTIPGDPAASVRPGDAGPLREAAAILTQARRPARPGVIIQLMGTGQRTGQPSIRPRGAQPQAGVVTPRRSPGRPARTGRRTGGGAAITSAASAAWSISLK